VWGRRLAALSGRDPTSPRRLRRRTVARRLAARHVEVVERLVRSNRPLGDEQLLAPVQLLPVERRRRRRLERLEPVERRLVDESLERPAVRARHRQGGDVERPLDGVIEAVDTSVRARS